jgi:hypothetical protein
VLIACASGSKSFAGTPSRKGAVTSDLSGLGEANCGWGLRRERNPLITAIDSNTQGRLRVGLFAACKHAA